MYDMQQPRMTTSALNWETQENEACTQKVGRSCLGANSLINSSLFVLLFSISKPALFFPIASCTLLTLVKALTIPDSYYDFIVLHIGESEDYKDSSLRLHSLQL